MRLESGPQQGDRHSIHSFIETRLAASESSVVYYDHGSGEVADFVAFTGENGQITVALFHCKRAGGEAPGDRVNDLYEVCGQALKSVVYADPARLFKQIAGRYDRRAGASRFIKGDLNILRQLVQSHRRPDFRFEMVVVQPGIARQQLSERSANLLSATSDHLVRGGFSSLRIMGS